MRLVSWLVRAFIFFVLFAFALNNQHQAVVHWFFGAQWRTPMIIVVLVAFAAGCAVGVVAMLPGLWRRRAKADAQANADADAKAAAASTEPATRPQTALGPITATPSELPAEYPSRLGI